MLSAGSKGRHALGRLDGRNHHAGYTGGTRLGHGFKGSAEAPLSMGFGESEVSSMALKWLDAIDAT